MKKLFLLSLFTVLSVVSNTCWAGMSSSRIRKEALYLSDKMAYELGLNDSQYDDVYEINYDFIYSLRNTLDYVVDGYEWAIDDYYDALDLRNDDLRWVLSNSQYRRFLKIEYFYRPISVATSGWFFRIYSVYTNASLFYKSHPSVYRSYKGGHFRESFSNQSYYQNRYRHNIYTGNVSVRSDSNYKKNRNSDFGNVQIRPNTSRSESGRNTVNTSTRRSSSSTTGRNQSDNVTRPTSTTSSVSVGSLRNQSSSSSNRGSSSDRSSSSSSSTKQPTTTPSSTNNTGVSTSGNRGTVGTSNNGSGNRNSSGSSSVNSSTRRSSSSSSSFNSGSSRSSSSSSNSGSSRRSGR